MIVSLEFSILSIAFPISSVSLRGSKFSHWAHHALGAASIFLLIRVRTLYLSLFPCLTAIHYDKIRAINVWGTWNITSAKLKCLYLCMNEASQLYGFQFLLLRLASMLLFRMIVQDTFKKYIEKMCNKATFAVTAFDSDNVSHWGKPFSYIPMWFYLIGELNRFPLMEKDVARTRFRLGNNKEGNNPTQVVEEISGASISLLISYIQPITISQVRILGFDFE